MKYKFTSTPDPDKNPDNMDANVTVEFNATTVQQMLEFFQDFLAGCGFAKYEFQVVESYDK